MRSHAKAIVAASAILSTLVFGTTFATAAAPVVTVDPASEIGVTSALATGEVDAEEKDASCRFEFVTDQQFVDEGNSFAAAEPSGQHAACNVNPVTGDSSQPVEAALNGLKAATTYHLRVVAANDEGTSEAVAATFETNAATAPALAVEPATAVSYTTATISGTVDPEGGNSNPIGGPVPIFWQLQYSSDPVGEGWSFANGGTIEGVEAEGSTPIPVTANLSGLNPGDEYSFRLVASFAGSLEEISAEEAFETLAVAPPVVSADEASAITGFGAHFSGTVEVTNANPAFDAGCSFEYISQVKYEAEGNTFAGASSVGCSPATVTGSMTQPVNVQANVSQLEPNQEYRLRIRAGNLGGVSTDEAPANFETPAVAPTLGQTFRQHLGSGEAALGGFVNPRNSAITSCEFSYGPSLSYGLSVPCEALPPTDNEPHRVRAEVSGLTPGATYHFKLTVAGPAGSGESIDSVFVAGGQAAQGTCPNAGSPGVGFLPECRAWEMVSPPTKEGADVSPSSWRVRVADDGSAVTYASLNGFGDVHGNTAWGTEYMAQRGTSHWVTHGIFPHVPAPVFPGVSAFGWRPGYMGDFGDDLSQGVFLSSTSLNSADPNVEVVSNLYLRDDLRAPGHGNYRLLSQCPGCTEPLPPEVTTEGEPLGLAFAGASDDFSHVIFESGDNLTGETTGDAPKVYEWLASTGEIRLAGVLPDDACGSPPCVATEGSVAGSGAGGVRVSSFGFDSTGEPHYSLSMNAISDDGSRIFFAAAPFHFPGGANPVGGELYYRDNGSSTTQINVSERTDCAELDPCSGAPAPDPAGHQPAAFAAASGDGSIVYFLSGEKLTDDLGDGVVNGGRYLYRAELDKPVGSRLTFVADSVVGISGISQDGELIYYLTEGDSRDPLLQRVNGSAGASLYVWHDGQSRYIVDHFTNPHGSSADHHLGIQGPTRNSFFAGENAFRITEDGRHIAFMSNMPTTARDAAGYDNTVSPRGDCNTTASNEFCIQIYVYDYEADELECASCNPSGAPPLKNALFRITRLSGPDFRPPDNPSQAVTEDGSLVFFSSADPLVPQDQNGHFDVYKYDTRTGEPSLLSSGFGDADAYFMNATPDGSSVFFTTRERLSRHDVDGSEDIYVARVQGGLPEPPFPPPACVGDACQPAPFQRIDPTPGSSTLSGPGDPAARRDKKARRCSRGKRRVKVRGGKRRCVKRKRDANRNGRAGR